MWWEIGSYTLRFMLNQGWRPRAALAERRRDYVSLAWTEYRE
jgi:hypothetical protein